MSSFVVINGKKYISNSAHDVIQNNTNSMMQSEYNQDATNGWMARSAELDKILKDSTYKAGRPKNVPQMGA